MAAISLRIDSKVYELDAVKKAAYRILSNASPQITDENSEFICALTFADNVEEADRDSVIAEFWKELLDQDLRARIARETASVRNAILSVAFSPVLQRRE